MTRNFRRGGRNPHPAVLLLILLAGFGVLPPLLLRAGEEYVTITLDRQEEGYADVLCAEKASAGASTAGTQPVPGNEPVSASSDAGNRGIRIYSFGKPLQVNRSYDVNHQEVSQPWRDAACQAYAAHAVELPAGYEYSWSTSEFIHRYSTGAYLPIREEWALAVTARTASYTLKESNTDANGNNFDTYRHSDISELDLGGLYSFSPELNAAAAILAGGNDGLITPGLRSSADFTPPGGFSFGGDGRLWVPWGENTLSALNNGRSSGGTLRSTLPLQERLDLLLSASNDWRYLAKSAFESDAYQGMESVGQARLSYALLHLPRAAAPVPFRNRETLTLEAPASGLNLYTNLLAGSYFQRPDDSPVPVTEHRFEQRFGINAAAALSSCLALSADSYVGYDTERKIDFGKLYGFSSQLDFTPSPWLRVYGLFGMDSEAATGISEGKTWRSGGGVSIKF